MILRWPRQPVSLYAYTLEWAHASNGRLRFDTLALAHAIWASRIAAEQTPAWAHNVNVLPLADDLMLAHGSCKPLSHTLGWAHTPNGRLISDTLALAYWPMRFGPAA